MEIKIDLNSKAEQKAQDCLAFSFCNSLNLANIKSKVASILGHIGDNGMFAEYTMHDISHVDGMLSLLDKIIPDDTRYQMTPADWLMTVLAVYFHDLGMHIPSGEYEKRNTNNGFMSTKEQMLKNDEIKQYVGSLEGDMGEKFLYQEYVRRNHGERVSEWITNCHKKNGEPYEMISTMLTGLDDGFRSDLALICKSHQMDELPDHLKSVDEAYGSSEGEKVNLLYVSVLLRSADILHMTHDRTPEVEYRIISPRNKISIIEWARQRAVRSIDIHKERDELGVVNEDIQPYSFEIQAKFTDDKGYFSFMSYLDYAVAELKRCHEWCEDSRKNNANKYFFPWKDINIDRVSAEGFSKSKLRFEIDQQNILKLLTGHTLYNDSTVVLRELIQNAMDAGKLQDSKSKSISKYQCKIEINWDSTNRILRVSDNATGMDTNTIMNFLLKVGSSKYQSESFKRDYPHFHSISRFGIGLLTCFMISDDIDIYTLDEKEKQCHLLKIRNLNGEYLMRNDADNSHILDGQHGTTFELKVRKDIKMDNIEQQIRQWIIVPFGKVTLTIDDGSPIIIGYETVQEAIEDYAKKQIGIDFTTNKYRVFSNSFNGVDIAFLQHYNSTMDVWSLYQYDDKFNSLNRMEAPIGVGIEGIRVTFNTPGIKGRKYLAFANCSGENSPTTNVARNDLEGGPALEKMYESIYEMYINSIVSQISDLSVHCSLTWATNKTNYLISSFYNSRSFNRTEFENRELLWKVLKNAKCIPVDNGKEIGLDSLNSLPDKITTIDSKAFNSVVSLLEDVNVKGKTAYGLLSELENHRINDEIILLENSVASCIRNLFLEDYEIIAIEADEDNRRIKFTWARKHERWFHIKSQESGYSQHLFILLDDNEVNIQGMGKKVSIVSNHCIFIVKESPLRSFMRHVINELKVKEDTLQFLSHMISELFTEHEIKTSREINNYLTKYLGERHNIDNITIEDLKKALEGYNSTLLNNAKYYRYWNY